MLYKVGTNELFLWNKNPEIHKNSSTLDRVVSGRQENLSDIETVSTSWRTADVRSALVEISVKTWRNIPPNVLQWKMILIWIKVSNSTFLLLK